MPCLSAQMQNSPGRHDQTASEMYMQSNGKSKQQTKRKKPQKVGKHSKLLQHVRNATEVGRNSSIWKDEGKDEVRNTIHV